MTKIRIVLIEDHELTRMNLRVALLQRSEIEIVGEAEDGERGLALLTKLQPDVAIIDINLPLKTGIEITREIKSLAQESDSPTKILILTFCDTKETVLAAFASGADSYCMKNITLDNLWDAVYITYQGNVWIDPAIAPIVLQQIRADSLMPALLDPSPVVYLEESAANPGIHESAFTVRELEVLQLIVEGCSNAAIAKKLYLTEGTVKNHVRRILNKIGASDRTQAAVYALRSGLVV